MNQAAHVMALSREVGHLVDAFSRNRGELALDFEHSLLFLALGNLNVGMGGTDFLTIQSVSVTALSASTGLPRETVRRKLLQLEAKQLIRRSGQGYILRDLATWTEFAGSVVASRTERASV